MDEDSVSNQPAQSTSTTRPSLAHNPSSNSGRPKGILKNAHPTGEGSTVNEGVRWDEVNLNLNEVEKEATTRMQILEPKWVHFILTSCIQLIDDADDGLR